MQGAYGLYRQSRNAAWRTLLAHGIDSLPVDIVRIATQNQISVLKNSDVHKLKDGEAGIAIYNGRKWFIVYDDSSDLADRRLFVVAHELGHIFLSRPLFDGYHRRTHGGMRRKAEIEADYFAGRLLAPSCVLWGLGLNTAAEIAEVCKLPADVAQIRADCMVELYKRNKFLRNPLERMVFEQFKAFIENYR